MRRQGGRPHLHPSVYGGGGVVHLLDVEKVKEEVKDYIIAETFTLHLEDVRLPLQSLIPQEIPLRKRQREQGEIVREWGMNMTRWLHRYVPQAAHCWRLRDFMFYPTSISSSTGDIYCCG